MTHRVGSSVGENKKFPMTGRPPDRNWMDMKRIRPRWTGNETRNTMDSGIEYTEDRYGPAPSQPGGRKRHADDDTLQRPFIDVPDSTEIMPWDDRCTDSTQYRGSFDDRDREGLRLLSPTLQQRVLKLQKYLEEAKAESRYFSR